MKLLISTKRHRPSDGWTHFEAGHPVTPLKESELLPVLMERMDRKMAVSEVQALIACRKRTARDEQRPQQIVILGEFVTVVAMEDVG